MASPVSSRPKRKNTRFQFKSRSGIILRTFSTAYRMDITPYLRLMVERNASDLFFSTGANVGIKIEGVVSPINGEKMAPGQVREIAYAIMNRDEIHAFEQDLELDFSLQADRLGRFRINVFRERTEVAMVVRYVKENIPSIEALNLPEILKKLVMSPRGLLLVVGNTGSGKSTTLASMIDYRNEHKSGHILTIEDPIEYLHPHKKSIVNQREVGQDTHSYSAALRRAVRESPDVIMMGEIRDRDTMEQALRYSQSGHLCISTLHATNAAQTIKRIINFFPDPNHQKELLLDLSLNLRAVISQRLLKTRDGHRMPAVEVMMVSPLIRNLIETGKVGEIDAAIEKGNMPGMKSMSAALHTLYKSDNVDLKELLFHADSSHDLLLRIKTGGNPIDQRA